MVINQTDSYLFSGRDFLPQVQIRLPITTDQPSPKALIVELQILCSTYIRDHMGVLPESNIGFSDQRAKVDFGHSADFFDKAKTHFLKKGHSPQQKWLKFCVWSPYYGLSNTSHMWTQEAANIDFQAQIFCQGWGCNSRNNLSGTLGMTHPIPSTLIQCRKCLIARCYSIPDILFIINLN